MNKTEQHKKAILEALEKNLGIVTTACRQVGIGRTTFYDWLKEDEDFKKKVDEINNVALDFTESKLFKLIEEQNPTAIIFHLKTKGKKRGYVERIEQDMNFQERPIFKEIDLNVPEDDSTEENSEVND
tara:strand:- start:4430 stop:4813 length:384 start_codon:yes stop_codon:yes gene_type:complete